MRVLEAEPNNEERMLAHAWYQRAHHAALAGDLLGSVARLLAFYRTLDGRAPEPSEGRRSCTVCDRLVLLESPYAGDVARNEAYARAAMLDCFRRGEYPFASHLLYTQPGVLRDDDPIERETGINAGLAWGELAARTVVYADHGITRGMQRGIERARELGRPVEIRYLRGEAP